MQTQTVTSQLTRSEAEERARAISNVDHYQIHLDVTDGNGLPGQATFRSFTTVEFTARDYTPEYFATILPVWQSRSPEVPRPSPQICIPPGTGARARPMLRTPFSSSPTCPRR